jgi:hypothetical protein
MMLGIKLVLALLREIGLSCLSGTPMFLYDEREGGVGN